ncbi:MAG TPA: diadenylate cyclase CdaA [Chitinophagales bacterium]|nr:diadenylate cyclase CdaA [Chitinophagales bacterium]
MLNKFSIGFLDIHFWDLVDIVLVGLLIFRLYKLLRGTLAFNILIGVLLVYVMAAVVNLLEMKVLATILGQFVEAGFILVVILFQQEIRRFLFYLGKGSGISKNKLWQLIFKRQTTTPKQELIEEIMRAINNMSNTRTGGLLVFTDAAEKNFFSDTGVPINGEISSKLIESIFDKGSPLHDGAVVIAENKILSAGCVLPVSENPDLPTRVGMRHRAATGITEKTDASVVIVSEQTGRISSAHKGRLNLHITQTDLAQLLDKVLE